MERAMSACALLGSDSVAATMICVALGALLVGLIVLGFGPLRSRLAPTSRSRPASEGVIGIWLLSRELDTTSHVGTELRP